MSKEILYVGPWDPRPYVVEFTSRGNGRLEEDSRWATKTAAIVRAEELAKGGLSVIVTKEDRD